MGPSCDRRHVAGRAQPHPGPRFRRPATGIAPAPCGASTPRRWHRSSPSSPCGSRCAAPTCLRRHDRRHLVATLVELQVAVPRCERRGRGCADRGSCGSVPISCARGTDTGDERRPLEATLAKATARLRRAEDRGLRIRTRPPLARGAGQRPGCGARRRAPDRAAPGPDRDAVHRSCRPARAPRPRLSRRPARRRARARAARTPNSTRLDATGIASGDSGSANIDAERAVFVELARTVGTTRAAWVARVTTPDPASRPAAPTPDGSPLANPPDPAGRGTQPVPADPAGAGDGAAGPLDRDRLPGRRRGRPGRRNGRARPSPGRTRARCRTAGRRGCRSRRGSAGSSTSTRRNGLAWASGCAG